MYVMNLMHLVSQKVGHDIQMACYLTLMTHTQVVSTYWMIWQIGLI